MALGLPAGLRSFEGPKGGRYADTDRSALSADGRKRTSGCIRIWLVSGQWAPLTKFSQV
jgi:hypothetical protein